MGNHDSDESRSRRTWAMNPGRDLADRRGPIGFMASNPIAANLLMAFFLFAGLFAAGDLVQEMLPDASLDLVQVVVPYPGAAPEEVGQAIVRKIEEEIGSVDGVQRIEASAAEGLGQQRQIVGALSGSLIVVFMIMFALLAIPFGSYSQPLIVMAAIPLGFVGAVLGHLLLGLSFGFMSLQGLVGCFGVVVNDSLVMINFINEKRDAGLEPREAIIVGTKARVRAILLTSVTTFLGVAPLVFERDPAAQHLVPVAAALAFGVLVATPLLMLVVPALVMSQANFGTRLRARFSRTVPWSPSGRAA